MAENFSDDTPGDTGLLTIRDYHFYNIQTILFYKFDLPGSLDLNIIWSNLSLSEFQNYCFSVFGDNLQEYLS